MVADVAQSVGGDCVSVTTMIGAGSDPHLYQPTPSDLAAMQQADLVLYSGLTLEGRLAAILDKIGAQRPTLAVAATAIPPERLLGAAEAGAEAAPDPHVWMDASLWALTAPVVAEAMGKLRPDCAAAMTEAAAAWQAQALALHDWARASIATIPEGQRRLVTAHDAFAYFGRAYDIPVASVQGLSTEAEASIADIEAVAAQVAEAGVPAVFVESTISPRTMEAVIEAARARGSEVAVGGELLSDAMGEAGTAAGTWIGMIEQNTRTVTTALGGTPLPLPPELAGWAALWAPGQ
jgi:manganese/zinc/iron transport system substrate-binding protein